MRIVRLRASILLSVLLLTACQTISPFSQKAYELATATKAEALTLMDKATESAATNTSAIQELELNLEKGYEYSRGRPDNEISARQWDILRDPKRNSIGGFLARWKKEQRLSAAFIEETKPVVSDGFDQVIELESGKRKPNSP